MLKKIRQIIRTFVYYALRKKAEIDHIQNVKSLYPEE